jgi:hypothetical protein
MEEKTMPEKVTEAAKKPNILVIWGDDIGISNLSCYSHGLMGYQTPNIDRLANEGMMFIDSYGEQSCTAGRSAFITGQSVYRTGLSKVGIPGAPIGMNEQLVTIAGCLKNQGYATGQFGKNHLGDLNKHLPTNHGFDQFFGNLYHLNAEEEPEMYDYFPEKDFPEFRKTVTPRGVLRCWAPCRRSSRIATTRRSLSISTPTTLPISPRACGNDGGTFMIAGPGLNGTPPAGIETVIHTETQFGYALFRTQLFNMADLPNVSKIQSGYHAERLSSFLHQPAPPSPPAVSWSQPADIMTPSPIIFSIIDFLFQFCPPNPSEKNLLARFAKLNIGPGQTFDLSKFSPRSRKLSMTAQ